MTSGNRGASDDEHNALALFGRWFELPVEQRDAGLARIRREVPPGAYEELLTLIRAGERADATHFLAGSAVDAIGTCEIPEDVPAKVSRIGPWSLEKSLGVGGMGHVWLATRHDGIYEGRVAIKMLRDAVADDFARERFALEGQILARLDHPNIARLLDAGILPDGERYLVLEYIGGERIDTYCDERKLDIASRIRLFLQVCKAVAHAHIALVVHRDIKPANILVMADGQAKLLDFGVAKLIEADSAATASPLTRVAGAGMTPEYAAPEQIEGNPITTATDIYSLGVVLYRLLTGSWPYGETSPSMARIARAIVEVEARPLSAGLSGHVTAAELAQRAELRSTTPERLKRLLSGDVENILAKTLRKKPSERYPSVLALADDLESYLACKPVSVRPDAISYRTGKFVRRHSLGVAAGAAVMVSAVAGVSGVVWQARIAIEQEARAEQQALLARQQALIAQNESAKARTEEINAKAQQAEAEHFRTAAQEEARKANDQREIAHRQTQTAKAEEAKSRSIKDFMIDIFRTNLPAAGDLEAAQQLTAKQLLENGSRSIGVKFADQPEVRAELLDIVGEIFFRLGDQDKARQLTLDRIALLDKMPESSAATKLDSVNNLSALAWAAGDTATMRHANDLLAQMPNADQILQHSENLVSAARVELYCDPKQALRLLSDALTGWRQLDHLTLTTGGVSAALIDTARAHALLGHHDLALVAANDALAAIRKTSRKGSYSISTATALVGEIQRGAELMTPAEHTLRAALGDSTRLLGAAHPETLAIKAQLGAVLREGPQHAEGMALLGEAVRQAGKMTTRNAIDEARMRLDLGLAYFDEGRFSESEALIATTVASLRPNPDLRLLLASALLAESRIHAVRGRGAQAIATTSEAHSIYAEALGQESPPTALALLHLAEAEVVADKVPDARASLELAESVVPPSGQRFGQQKVLAEVLGAEMRLLWGEVSSARAEFEAVAARIDADADAGYHRVLQARALLGAGRAALADGDLQHARAALQRAVDLRSRVGPPDNPWLAEARLSLADCMVSLGQREAAATLLTQAEASFAAHGPLGRQFLYPIEKITRRLQPAGNRT